MSSETTIFAKPLVLCSNFMHCSLMVQILVWGALTVCFLQHEQ